jgi:hypothetical protein
LLQERHHSRQILFYIYIQNMDDAQTQAREIGIALCIVIRLVVMTAAIHFDNRLHFSAVKINNVIADDFLTIKIQTFELPFL